MELIPKYFPDLTDTQRSQFEQLKDLYEHWNAQINVISRKDMDEFYERHVLHSLGIAKVMLFTPGIERSGHRNGRRFSGNSAGNSIS